MAITAAEVAYIARLARLSFDEAEQADLVHQMNDILAYMDKLNELDTAEVPPMSHVLDLHNVFRTPGAQQRISREEALKNAPDADEAYFRVPKVIS